MFGFGRVAKAAEFSSEAVRQLLAPFSLKGGLPLGFWADSYVIGYLSGCIGMLATLSSGGRVRGDDTGRVLINTFDKLTNGQGLDVVREGNKLFAEGNKDYREGLDNGTMSVVVTYGGPGVENDFRYSEAEFLAKTMRSSLAEPVVGPLTAAEVGAQFHYLNFYQRVEARLGRRDA